MAILMGAVKESLTKGEFEGERRILSVTESMDNIIEKASNISLNIKDSYAKKLWFDENLNFHYLTKDGVEVERQITYWAFSQICKMTDVGIKYIHKCIKNQKTELAVKNLNTWLSDFSRSRLGKEKLMLIREYADYMNGNAELVRGILSEQYSVSVESVSVLRALKKNLDLSRFSSAGSYIDYERLHLRLYSVDDKKSISKCLKDYGELGAGLASGIVVENSEVGQSKLNIYIMLYRLACKNGMIMIDNDFKLFSKRHIGLTIEDFSNSIKNIEYALENFNGVMSKSIIESIEGKYSDTQIERIYEKLKKDAQLNKRDIEAIQVKRSEKYSDFGDVWGIVNAITDVAHMFDVDKRMRAERAASNIMINIDEF